MKRTDDPNRSQLFLVRLWLQGELGDEGSSGREATTPVHGDPDAEHSMHGKVQHVITGKTADFTDCHSLMRCLSMMMPRTNANANASKSDTPGRKGTSHNDCNA